MPDLHFNRCNPIWISRTRGLLTGAVLAHLGGEFSADFTLSIPFPTGSFPTHGSFPDKMLSHGGRSSQSRAASRPAQSLASRGSSFRGTGPMDGISSLPALGSFQQDLTLPTQGLVLSVGFTTPLFGGWGKDPSPGPCSTLTHLTRVYLRLAGTWAWSLTLAWEPHFILKKYM